MEVDATTAKLKGTQEGMIKFVDTNEDGKITAEDRIRKFTSAIPEIQYGIHANAAYKGFDFNVLFQGQAEAEIEVYYDRDGALPTHFFDDRWTTENRNALYPRAWGQDDIYVKSWKKNKSEGIADLWLEDASFIRMKEIELGYSFSKKMIPFADLRVYVRGSNLCTWSSLKDFDPEMDGYHNFSNGFYTPLKSYTFGLNIQF